MDYQLIGSSADFLMSFHTIAQKLVEFVMMILVEVKKLSLLYFEDQIVEAELIATFVNAAVAVVVGVAAVAVVVVVVGVVAVVVVGVVAVAIFGMIDWKKCYCSFVVDTAIAIELIVVAQAVIDVVTGALVVANVLDSSL